MFNIFPLRDARAKRREYFLTRVCPRAVRGIDIGDIFAELQSQNCIVLTI